MARANPRRPAGAHSQRMKAACFGLGGVVCERERLLLRSLTNDCSTGNDGLYNPLLLGAANDTEDLATSAMNSLPGTGLNPLPDSGNVSGAVICESAFATADFDCSDLPRVS